MLGEQVLTVVTFGASSSYFSVARYGASESVTLYRGVRSTHPGFQNAMEGIAKPRSRFLGHSDPLKHNTEFTKSKFTSWTTDRNIAQRFSGRDGIILETDVAKRSTIVSPNLYKESEVLLRGVIKGAKVTKP